MNEYGAIAYVYDLLNAEIDYTVWADFVEECFRRFGNKKPELVLDMACGTGSMTIELARRGYDMTGADASIDMLTVARERAYQSGLGDKILLLAQDMRNFELYGTVGAVVCCLDSVNYLADIGDVKKFFSCVHNYTDPDGLFIFDVNTPYKFENVYADNVYILEGERNGTAVFCTWQNFYNRSKKVCDFCLSLFEESETDGRYTRYDENQRETCYLREELTDCLEECGFEVCGVFGGFDFSKPDANCERWYICCKAKKPQALPFT